MSKEEKVDCVGSVEKKFKTCPVQEVKVCQKAASESEPFSAAAEVPLEGVITGDLYGFITDVNDAIIKMYGAADKNKFVGKHVTEFLVKSDRERAVRDSLDILTSGQGKTCEYRVLTSSGEEVLLEVTIKLIRDENGDQIGFVDAVRNISNRKKNGEELKKNERGNLERA